MQFNQQEKVHLEEASELLRAITHPLRISILNYISEHQPARVHDIHTHLRLEQSITSQHLRVLREAGIIIPDRRGKNIYYRIDHPKMVHSANAIRRFDLTTLERRKRPR